MNKHEFLNSLKRITLSSGHTDTKLGLIYILMAWKSSSNLLEKKYKFHDFFVSDIEVSRFFNIFESIKDKLPVIDTFLNTIALELMNPITPITKDDLQQLCNFVNLLKSLPPVVCGIKVINNNFSTLSNNTYPLDSNISKLLGKLINNDLKTVYIPFYNDLEFIEHINSQQNKKFYTESKTMPLIQELAKALDNIDITHSSTDPLIEPNYIDTKDLSLKKFDCSVGIIAFEDTATYNYSKEKLENDKYDRFKTFSGSAYNVAFIEHTLAQTKDKAFFYIPVGLTYKSGSELDLRAYLTKNNLIDSVIQFAPNLNANTTFQGSLLIIDKNKKDTRVKFINLAKDIFLKKEGRRIVLDNLAEIINIYNEDKNIEDICSIVENSEIEKNRFSFSVDKYIESEQSIITKKYFEKHGVVELQNIALVKRSQLFKNEEEGEDVYELSPSDFADAGLTFGYNGKIKKIKNQTKKLLTYKLQNSDLLLSTKGTIGKVALVSIEGMGEPTITSQANMIIRLTESDSSKKFYKAIEIYMFLKSNIGQVLLKKLVSGTSMPQISTDDIKKLKIPLLSEIEQKKVIKSFSDEERISTEILKLKEKIEEIHKNSF